MKLEMEMKRNPVHAPALQRNSPTNYCSRHVEIFSVAGDFDGEREGANAESKSSKTNVICIKKSESLVQKTCSDASLQI